MVFYFIVLLLYMYSCTRACVSICLYICVCVFFYICSCIYVYVYMYVCIFIYALKCVCVYIYIYRKEFTIKCECRFDKIFCCWLNCKCLHCLNLNFNSCINKNFTLMRHFCWVIVIDSNLRFKILSSIFNATLGNIPSKNVLPTFKILVFKWAWTLTIKLSNYLSL